MNLILKGISSESSISPILGFKGGTCAYFFYDLPRFSVDLDFDLLNSSVDSQNIAEKIGAILGEYGEIRDLRVKRYTIFGLLSYGLEDHNIKIEINTRDATDHNVISSYGLKKYLGIPLLVAQKEYLFATKLIALLGRNTIAMRDIFDIHYFAKNSWSIDTDFVEKKTGKAIDTYLDACITAIESVPKNSILTGLGELLEEKQKHWVRTNLKTDTVFLLRSYKEMLMKIS